MPADRPLLGHSSIGVAAPKWYRASDAEHRNASPSDAPRTPGRVVSALRDGGVAVVGVGAEDEGGTMWEGEGRYETLDEALGAMEAGLIEFLEAIRMA